MFLLALGLTSLSFSKQKLNCYIATSKKLLNIKKINFSVDASHASGKSVFFDKQVVPIKRQKTLKNLQTTT